MATPVITLNNGVQIPQVGLGVFQVPEPDTQALVEDAIASGYRHIDTAAGYYNEAGVGAAVKACGLPRQDIFVTTKLRNGDQGYDSTLRAFDNSRAELGLDVVDLFLIHWPVPSADLYLETWRAFEKLYADGAVRAIGVSNFMPTHIDRLVANSEVLPVVNQIEVHPTFQNLPAQGATAAHKIALQAYSPLGRGADLEAPAVLAVAARLGATPAQVIVAWHLAAGRIVIPKSVTPERYRANLAATELTLSLADIESLDTLESGNRLSADPEVAAFTQFRD